MTGTVSSMGYERDWGISILSGLSPFDKHKSTVYSKFGEATTQSGSTVVKKSLLDRAIYLNEDFKMSPQNTQVKSFVMWMNEMPSWPMSTIEVQ